MKFVGPLILQCCLSKVCLHFKSTINGHLDTLWCPTTLQSSVICSAMHPTKPAISTRGHFYVYVRSYYAECIKIPNVKNVFDGVEENAGVFLD